MFLKQVSQISFYSKIKFCCSCETRRPGEELTTQAPSWLLCGPQGWLHIRTTWENLMSAQACALHPALN